MPWGLPKPQAAAGNSIREQCMCGALNNEQGHHIQNCAVRNRGKWQRAHTLVLKEWKSVTLTVRVTATDLALQTAQPSPQLL